MIIKAYRILDFEKWRLAYEAGLQFIDRYLVKFSSRETDTDFRDRKNITYCPAFAKAGINEIKNSLFPRLSEVTRVSGPPLYHDLVSGNLGGIDGSGNTIENFLGQYILPELLIMGIVGVYVDREPLDGITLRDAQNKNPYCYYYKAEQILGYKYSKAGKLEKLLLKDINLKNEDNGMYPLYDNEFEEQIRFVFINSNNKVEIHFFKNTETLTIKEALQKTPTSTLVLDISEIPFVFAELSDSLMKDIAPYQIALLNMASSDLAYILKSNTPFYTEQGHNNPLPEPGENGEGLEDEVPINRTEIRVGATQGRRYAPGMERPGFIHPSPEPIRASMEKQEQCQKEIRLLLNLAITNLTPTKAISAESKAKDEGSLESGLSYIGLTLQYVEKQIAHFISLYLGTKNEPEIYYPQKYSLITEEERRLEIKNIAEIIPTTTILSLRKELYKRLADLLLCRAVPDTVLEKIYKEIDSSEYLFTPNEIIGQVNSIIKAEFAVKALGYPEEATVEEPEPKNGVDDGQSENVN